MLTNSDVSGTGSGTEYFDVGSPECPSFYDSYDGSFVTSSGGTVRLSVATCATFTSGGVSETGTFILRTGQGGRLNGTVDGFVAFANPGGLAHLTLTVTSSRGLNRNVTGTIHAELAVTPVSTEVSSSGTNVWTGTLTGDLVS